MSVRRRVVAALATGALLALSAGAAADAADWQPWPMPVPAGGRYETPVGVPGDLKFWGANRGLMTVGGNNAVPEGLLSWNGVAWHQLAVVCGSGDQARIAWAGPDEFWTIARASLPRPQNAGMALCHFKGGEVVGSYSTVPAADDPYHPMYAAACNGPADCWFAGAGGQDGTGRHRGAFHLHWDGARLQTVYGPQGRAVSDLLAHGGRLYESTYLGGAPNSEGGTAILGEPEAVPRLLHDLTGGVFANLPFAPSTHQQGTELRALDSDGQTAWAVGGGANPSGQPAQRPPLAVRLDGGTWTELALHGDPLAVDHVFGDVAAIPGTRAAWATLVGTNEGTGELSQPQVVRIGADGAAQLQVLAADTDPIKGSASRIACPTANDCWLATARGYLYRLVGAPALPLDADPAFQGTITVRPNEAAEQSIPDDPPVDDSLLLAPPVELTPQVPAGTQAASCPTVPSLVTKVRSTIRGRKRLQLVISFTLARRASVGVTARRGGKVVARAKVRTLRRGKRSLTLDVSRKRWPTKLSFVVRGDAPGAGACPSGGSGSTSGGNDENTVVTGGAASVTTRAVDR